MSLLISLKGHHCPSFDVPVQGSAHVGGVVQAAPVHTLVSHWGKAEAGWSRFSRSKHLLRAMGGTSPGSLLGELDLQIRAILELRGSGGGTKGSKRRLKSEPSPEPGSTKTPVVPCHHDAGLGNSSFPLVTEELPIMHQHCVSKPQAPLCPNPAAQAGCKEPMQG